MTNEELVDQIQKEIHPAENMEQLYQQNYRLIFLIARKYSHNDELDDLLQEAYFGLSEAVKLYESTAGVKFMSYATYWIRQSIQRHLENNGRCIRIPVAMQGNIHKYNRVMAAFHMTLEATGQLLGKSRDMARQLEANALRKLRSPRIRRELEEKFEVNYARAYSGSVTSFRYTGTSIVEDIAVKNMERELDFIRIILERDNWRELLSKREYELAKAHNLIDENMEE